MGNSLRGAKKEAHVQAPYKSHNITSSIPKRLSTNKEKVNERNQSSDLTSKSMLSSNVGLSVVSGILSSATKKSSDSLNKLDSSGNGKAITRVSESNNSSVDGQFLNHKVAIEDFELLRVLGRGSFGKVMLVKKKDDANNTLYAMKTLRKQQLVKRNQLDHAETEKYVLQQIHNPFLVHLYYAFQTMDKLYMVIDYMGGGELFYWLKKDKKFSENRCRLYAAELSLALDALHSKNIVYRDLKPENILLDSQGHIRVTDFGLAKGNITGAGAEGGTKTFCGTSEYLAPEILENTGHGKAVDWWALGTFLFEMLTGLPPFFDHNVQKMYHKIIHDPLKFPKSDKISLSEATKDVLRRLLDRNIATRLCSTNGVKEIEGSQFFQPLDFKVVMSKGYRAEFIPPLAKHEGEEGRNFDTEFTSEPAADSYVASHMSATMQQKSNFENFTYQDKPHI